MPFRSSEEKACDNVLAPAADLDVSASAHKAFQPFPDLPDDDALSPELRESATPIEDETAAEPHKGQKELF